IASSTNSRESLAIAKNWIRTCLYSHTSCNRQASKSLQRPTRLIFLGVENSREMRIVEQEYISRSVKYMTLSHRWGDANRAQLTISNYSDFKQGISKEYLPKAFFDAMEMARRLGIFYLWIDCLCIIQDSSADWNHESSNIADIYAGSWCNLAATCAVDDRQSLHVERNPPEIEGCVIKDSLGEPFKVEGNDDGARAWDGYVKNAPLMSRAWVFQEVSSAPRTLHFGQDQMYWQCSTQKACEGSPSELNMSRKRYQPEIIPPVESFQGPPGWANIVHQYSSCQLTFPIKDKLVALSGIARKYGAEMDYLAGLWEPDVLLQLPWKLNNPQDPSARPTEYQAPSWSWTSINNEIRYNELAKKPRTTQMLAKLLDADIVLATDDAFGRLTDGALTIRGSLVKLEYKRPSSIHKGPILPGTTFNLLPRNIPVSVDLDFNDDLSEGMIYYCLPLYFDLLGKLRENVHCLVLEPTGNKGEYVRKGTMILGEKSMSSGAGVGVWDVVRFVGCCKEGEGDIGENLYEGKEGEGWGLPMFVVTIV
ncbi:heterokaryon incompatibility protein-domain-containing protein, partial [Halenospora varia]